MSAHHAQMPAIAKPVVVVPLFVIGVIALATLPSLLGNVPYGQQAIQQQIAREDGTLCEKFGFTADSSQHADCKAALMDLRNRHELLLSNWSG
jgi:hypothetical protein